jgi:hypothetical protein
MKNQGPAAHRSIAKAQLIVDKTEEFPENYMSHNGVCIRAIDPRGKNQVVTKRTEASMKPA